MIKEQRGQLSAAFVVLYKNFVLCYYITIKREGDVPMKRIICILLVLVMCVGLCACGESGASDKKEGLYVGFGREVVLPKGYEVHMGGGDWKSRKTSSFRDDICTTCIAFTEGDKTLLVFTLDFMEANDVFVNPAREAVSQATGISADNIWMNATHTHSSVGIAYDWDKSQTYRDAFNQACVEAAQTAIADQGKSDVFYGGVQTEGMAFVRHYNMSDGSVAGANFGSFSNGSILGHTVDADTELQLVNFVRQEEGKKDILMVSFPAHCTINQTSTVLSADYPFYVRTYVEANANANVAFFQGASGDQVPSSQIPGESFSKDYKIYGEKLGQYALEAIPTLTKQENSKLSFKEETYVGQSNKENIDKLPEAQIVQQVIDQYSKTSQEAKAAALKHGFSSVYESTAVISRARSSETRDLEMRVFSLGEVGFVLAPYEMFCKHSMKIKEDSPFKETFMITLGQGGEGYLPTIQAFEYESYEACVSHFARGTGETLVEKYVEMLNELNS